MPEIPLEAWITLLDRLITKAQTTLKGTADDRQEVRTQLLGFIKSTPPQYEFLDDIARDVLHNFNDASLEIATNGIKNAANALEKQRLIISLATSEAKKDATAISLEHLTQKIDQAKKDLEHLKDVNAILGKDEAFSEKVTEIQKKLEELK